MQNNVKIHSTITHLLPVVELRGGPRGPDPLKDRVALSKHLVWEGTRGLLKGPLKSPVKFNTWLQRINIILSTDGAAPSPATW